MRIPKIIPGFSTGRPRKDNPNAAAADAEFKDLREKALRRDKYCCLGCGMKVETGAKGESWLHVHHIDFNHEHNELDNYATLCSFCHGVLHLGFETEKKFPGNAMRVVWLPEITQAELNLLSWTLAIAIHRGGDAEGLPSDAKKMAQAIIKRQFPAAWPGTAGAEVFKKRMLGDAENPCRFLCELLAGVRKADARLYDNRETWLSGLRVFYDPAHERIQDMKEVAAYSEAGVWSPGETWEETWKSVAAQYQEKREGQDG